VSEKRRKWSRASCLQSVFCALCQHATFFC
jgi:hypothetical protein